MPLPTVSETQLELILMIYRLFERTNDWPTFELLDYELDQLERADAAQLLRSLPQGLAIGIGWNAPLWIARQRRATA